MCEALKKWKGKEAIVEILAKFGVRYVFGNPGTTEIPFLDALAERDDLQYILCLHDAIAVGMAHGFAAASERPALANLHAAPGVANAMGSIYNAFRAGVPLVITAGQSDQKLQALEPPLWADIATLVRPFVKWSWEARTAQELPLVMARALKVATDTPQGPVFLSLPMNLLDEEIAGEIPIPRISLAYASPGPGSLDEAAQVLAQAERPLIVAGDGVAKAHAVRSLVRLAETIAAKVYAERMPHRIAFPTGHPLYFGPIGFQEMEIQANLADADVILLAGTNRIIPVVYQGSPLIPPGAKVIQVDADPWEAGKNVPGGIVIVANVRATLEILTHKVEQKLAGKKELIMHRRSALETMAIHRKKALEEEVEQAWDNVPISISRLVRELRHALPGDAIIVDESSTSSLGLHRYFEFPHENTYFGIKGGSLGYGLPAALGIKLARPQQPVVAFIGDGAALYLPQALWTAAHYGIAVIILICNNFGYRILREGFRNYNGAASRNDKFIGCTILEPMVDFIHLAQAFGVKARTITNPEDLKISLAEAVHAHHPFLLNVLIEHDEVGRLF
ncbi:MAG: thiamine pyrophosphate-binding protein [Armatimonadota bacterium]|nr:thiamine pyrophosphate-binding protein [Armatimonadota bacterium]